MLRNGALDFILAIDSIFLSALFGTGKVSYLVEAHGVPEDLALLLHVDDVLALVAAAFQLAAGLGVHVVRTGPIQTTVGLDIP